MVLSLRPLGRHGSFSFPDFFSIVPEPLGFAVKALPCDAATRPNAAVCDGQTVYDGVSSHWHQKAFRRVPSRCFPTHSCHCPWPLLQSRSCQKLQRYRRLPRFSSAPALQIPCWAHFLRPGLAIQRGTKESGGVRHGLAQQLLFPHPRPLLRAYHQRATTLSCQTCQTCPTP